MEQIDASKPWANSQMSVGAPPSEMSTTKSTAELYANRKANDDAALEHLRAEKDYLCGVLSFRPAWLQRFAHPRWYFINYVMMGIISGAYKTYLIGTLSTIERRFQMSNSTTAIILIADNISPIFINLVAGYYANRISRPKLMSIGSLIVVTGCIMSILPFLIYGPAVTTADMGRIEVERKVRLCHNDSLTHLPDEGSCGRNDASISWLPFMLFLLANFLNGTGGSVYFVVGSTYMDDNIKKKNSPFYFSLSFALRLFGPVLGFLTSAFCLSYNEDIFHGAPRSLSTRDPKWIGAWWLGYIFFGLALTLVAIPMMFFPRILPMGRDQKANRVLSKSVTGKGAPKDMCSAVRRLCKNPIFVLKSLGFVFIIIGSAGYGTSFTKYMEHQFGRSPASASFISGTSKVLTNMIGIMAGGIFIQLLRPSPRKVAAYVAIVEILYMLGYVWLLFVGCSAPKIVGLHSTSTGFEVSPSDVALTSSRPGPWNTCNVHCGCSPNDFGPVCAPNGRTFFSPCFAGCRSTRTAANETLLGYGDCACIGNDVVESNDTVAEAETTAEPSSETGGFPYIGSVSLGVCGPPCTAITMYLAIVILCQLIGSTARSGSMLLYLRCVDPTDKSMALGTSSSLINLIAFIPYPLIYGYVLDRSCILWGRTCNGAKGSCKLYDVDLLRYSLHLTTIGFLFIAVICYVMVVFYAHRIKHFYSEPDDDDVVDEKTTTITKSDEEANNNKNKKDKNKQTNKDHPVTDNQIQRNGGNVERHVNADILDSAL